MNENTGKFISINWSILPSRLRMVWKNLFQIKIWQNLLDKSFWSLLLLLTLYFIFKLQINDNLHSIFYFENVNSEHALYPLIPLISILIGTSLLIQYFRWTYIGKRHNNFTIVLFLLFCIVYFDLRYFISSNPYPFNPLETFFPNVRFLDYIFIPTSLYLFFGKMPKWVSSMCNKYLLDQEIVKERTNLKTEKNILIEDNPYTQSTSHEAIVKRLIQIIENDYYRRSYSIGIVGPWGNGKSSLLENFKNELANLDSYTDERILLMEFSPFSNHNNDIIGEFFNQFGNLIEPYNSRMSTNLIDYGQKLNNLINNGEISNFIEKATKSEIKLSIHEYYEELSKSLTELDRKIVVLVDDLDRLSEKEILLTLKLIRNSANFPNLLFIVAMDKDYVIQTLSKESQRNAKFIEKFFQLEIYLREIPKQFLKKEFEGLIQRSNSFSSNVKTGLIQSISDKNNLFESYIFNVRDIKKLVNHIIFEQPFVIDDVDFTDYLNFMYLKGKFPKFIQLLNENRDTILDLVSSYYTLKIMPTKKDGGKNDIDQSYLQRMFTTQNNLKTFNYKEYELTQALTLDNENCITLQLDLSCSERELLSSTLITLFDKDPPKSPYQIKNQDVFLLLMNMDYSIDHLKKSEFEALIKSTKDETHEKTRNILENKKGAKLIERLSYLIPKSTQELKTVGRILFHLLDKHIEYNLYFSELTKLLGIFLNLNNSIESSFEKIRLNPDKLKLFVNENFFENKSYYVSNKIEILSLLFNNKIETQFWGLDQNEVDKLALDYLNQYLDGYKFKVSDIDNLTPYRYFNLLTSIAKNEKEGLKFTLKEHILKSNLQTFCAQSIQQEPFYPHLYEVDNFVLSVFDSYENYRRFILNHKDSSTPAILEYLKFLKISEITSFSFHLKFIFNYLQLRDYSFMGKILEHHKKESENQVQLFFKLSDELKEINPNYSTIGITIGARVHSLDNEQFMYLSTYKENKDKFIPRVLNWLKLEIENFKPNSNIEIDFDLISTEMKADINEINSKSNQKLVELFDIQYGKPKREV